MGGLKQKPQLQSRFVAIDILSHIYNEVSLKYVFEHQKFVTLSLPAKAYVKFLVTQTIRYQNVIRHIIDQYLLKKPQNKALDYVYAILSLGSCEIFLSDQKSNHTLNSYTDIAKSDAKFKHLSPLIRAVLGKILDNKNQFQSLFQDYKLIFGSDLYHKIYNDYQNETSSICNALLQEPSLDIVKLTNCPTPEGYKELSDTSCRKLPDNLIRPEKLGLFLDGDITIQSYASHLAINALGSIKDKTLIDLCAAPGSKTLQALSKGAKVTALDISEKRLEKLYENLKRTHLKADIMTADALNYKTSTKFDIVLLDAPCSATGTIRKNPDIILNFEIKKLSSVLALQYKLLLKAHEILNTNGIIIYAVCSLLKAEGEEQIGKFISEYPEYVIIPPKNTINFDQNMITPQGYIRLLPQYDLENGGHDGFFIAYLQRN